MLKRKASDDPSTPPRKTRKVANIQKHKPFRFLDLPSELRNRIYEHLFEGSTTTIRPGYPFPRRKWTFVHKPANRPNGKRDGLPALLATTRQLRNEALGIFYAGTSWEISSDYQLAILLGILGPQRIGPRPAPETAERVETIRYVIPCSSSATKLDSACEKVARMSLGMLGMVVKCRGLLVRDGLIGLEIEGIEKVWLLPSDDEP